MTFSLIQDRLKKQTRRLTFLIIMVVIVGYNPAHLDAQSNDIALDFMGDSLNGFNANLTLGWSFRVNDPICVTDLGFFDHFNSDEDGLAQDHRVRLWTDEMMPVLIADTTITNESTPDASTAANGRWLFNSIEPVLLLPGDYIIGADDPACSGNCDRFRFIVANTTIQEITFLEARSSSPPGPPQSPHPDLHAGYFGPTFKVAPSGILLGDVNGDGSLDLLDVAPFVDAIATGTFIAAADINKDGSANLLDVGPFVALLGG